MRFLFTWFTYTKENLHGNLSRTEDLIPAGSAEEEEEEVEIVNEDCAEFVEETVCEGDGIAVRPGEEGGEGVGDDVDVGREWNKTWSNWSP